MYSYVKLRPSIGHRVSCALCVCVAMSQKGKTAIDLVRDLLKSDKINAPFVYQRLQTHLDKSPAASVLAVDSKVRMNSGLIDRIVCIC